MKRISLLLTTVLGMSHLLADGNMSNQSATPMMVDNAFLKEPMTPPTPAIMPNRIDAILTADFIWWKTTIDNVEYAASGVAPGASSTSGVTKGKFYGQDFDYQPGFKIALGMTTGHDGWDLIAEYTWVNPQSGHRSVSNNGSSGLSTTSIVLEPDGTGFEFDGIDSASSSFSHHFNVVDLMLGRNFFISKFLALKPQVGWKFAWTKDHYNLNYGISATTTSTPNYKTKSFGSGIRAGIESLWHFNKHWGLYGDLFLTGLWSWVKASDNQKFNTTPTVNNSNHLQALIPVIEFGLGFDYTTWFCNNSCEYFLRAGWEQQAWVDYSRIAFVSNMTTGNMNIQGLTIKTGFVW